MKSNTRLIALWAEIIKESQEDLDYWVNELTPSPNWREGWVRAKIARIKRNIAEYTLILEELKDDEADLRQIKADARRIEATASKGGVHKQSV